MKIFQTRLCEHKGGMKIFQTRLCEHKGGMKIFQTRLCEHKGGMKIFQTRLCEHKGGMKIFQTWLCEHKGGMKIFQGKRFLRHPRSADQSQPPVCPSEKCLRNSCFHGQTPIHIIIYYSQKSMQLDIDVT